MRAFLAVEFPTPTLRQISTIQQKLAQQLREQQLDHCVRWTPARNVHLTLRFLGEIDETQCTALRQSMPAVVARYAPFSVRIDGVGCFPDMKRPTVIWCGLQGELHTLMQMQEAVASATQRVGIAPEQKRFKPHLTIGRTQRNATLPQLRSVGAVVAQFVAQGAAQFVAQGAAQGAANLRSVHAGEPAQVDRLILFQSELTPSGPIYTRLDVFPLVGG